MANVFIIHGAYGHPGENWFPWLKEELERRGHQVFVPAFPTPSGQTLENWLRVFKSYEQYLDENSIVVGHSLGVPFLLHVLEKHKVKAAFFVSGFCEVFPENQQFQMDSFVDHELDWKVIRKNCPSFLVYHSDNDPYIPLERAENLARNLGIKVMLKKGSGHFNQAAGYLKFEDLLSQAVLLT